jgi:hypothetical protein
MDVVTGADGAGAAEEMKVARRRFHADRFRVRKRSFYAQMHKLERLCKKIHFPREKLR